MFLISTITHFLMISCFLLLLSVSSSIVLCQNVTEDNSTTTSSILIVSSTTSALITTEFPTELSNTSTTNTTTSTPMTASSSSTVFTSTTTTTEETSSTLVPSTTTATTSSSSTEEPTSVEPSNITMQNTSMTSLAASSSTSLSSTTETTTMPSSTTSSQTTTTKEPEEQTTSTSTSSTTTQTTFTSSTTSTSSTSEETLSSATTTTTTIQTSPEESTNTNISSSSTTEVSSSPNSTNQTAQTSTTLSNFTNFTEEPSTTTTTTTLISNSPVNFSNWAPPVDDTALQRSSQDVSRITSDISVYFTPILGFFASASAPTIPSKLGVIRNMAECQPALNRQLTFFENPLQMSIVLPKNEEEENIDTTRNDDDVPCFNDDEDDPRNHPLCFLIPSSIKMKYQVGAFVGNLIILASVFVLQMLAALLHYLCIATRRKNSAKEKRSTTENDKEENLLPKNKNSIANTNNSPSFYESLGFSRFPSLFIPFVAVLMIPLTSQTLTILINGNTESRVLVSVFLVVFLICLILLFLITHLRKNSFLATFRSMLAVDAARASKVHKDDEFDLECGTKWGIFARKGQWFDVPRVFVSSSSVETKENSSSNHEQQQHDLIEHLPVADLEKQLKNSNHTFFVQRYGLVFDKYKDRRHWWFLLEVITCILLGIFDAVRGLEFRSGCLISSVLSLVLIIVHLLLVIHFRPFNLFFEQICQVVIGVLVIGAASCSVAASVSLYFLTSPERNTNTDRTSIETMRSAALTALDVFATFALIVVMIQILTVAFVDHILKFINEKRRCRITEEEKEEIRRGRQERAREKRMQNLRLKFDELTKQNRTGDEDEEVYSESGECEPWSEMKEMGLVKDHDAALISLVEEEKENEGNQDGDNTDQVSRKLNVVVNTKPDDYDSDFDDDEDIPPPPPPPQVVAMERKKKNKRKDRHFEMMNEIDDL